MQNQRRLSMQHHGASEEIPVLPRKMRYSSLPSELEDDDPLMEKKLTLAIPQSRRGSMARRPSLKPDCEINEAELDFLEGLHTPSVKHRFNTEKNGQPGTPNTTRTSASNHSVQHEGPHRKRALSGSSTFGHPETPEIPFTDLSSAANMIFMSSVGSELIRPERQRVASDFGPRSEISNVLLPRLSAKDYIELANSKKLLTYSSLLNAKGKPIHGVAKQVAYRLSFLNSGSVSTGHFGPIRRGTPEVKCFTQIGLSLKSQRNIGEQCEMVNAKRQVAVFKSLNDLVVCMESGTAKGCIEKDRGTFFGNGICVVFHPAGGSSRVVTPADVPYLEVSEFDTSCSVLQKVLRALVDGSKKKKN